MLCLWPCVGGPKVTLNPTIFPNDVTFFDKLVCLVRMMHDCFNTE